MGDTKPQVAAFTELDSGTLYALLKLRVDVFVVEQECPYPELDGRDTEPGSRHVWLSGDSGAPEAYLRVLDDPDGARIGRVVTAPHARGAGLGARLMEAALEVIGDRTARLDAQTQVSGFYARYGFVVDGPEYIEDGIPHVPMVRLTADR
ncbi:GNAT family N-acetyltransferase [Actinoallomurus sp. NPDC050550]|uniref:GNAT family N-acetyltransferase n=1 Tax=Actinoallomurus sp. NPDC050550 TaxID=3154937 RepID=UPI00340B8F97